jgi:hypothetical protein
MIAALSNSDCNGTQDIAHLIIFRHLVISTGLAAEQMLGVMTRVSKQQDATGTSFASLVHSVQCRSPPLDEVDQRSQYLLRLLTLVENLRCLATGSATHHMFHVIDIKARNLWHLSTILKTKSVSSMSLIGGFKHLRKLVIRTFFAFALPSSTPSWNLPLLQTIVWNDEGVAWRPALANVVKHLERCQLESLQNLKYTHLGQSMAAQEGESWERLLFRQPWHMISMDVLTQWSADVLSKTRVDVIELHMNRLWVELSVPSTCRSLSIIHDLDHELSYPNLGLLLSAFEATPQSPFKSLREVYFTLTGMEPVGFNEDRINSSQIISRVVLFKNILAARGVALYNAGDGVLAGLPRRKNPWAHVFEEL